MKLSVRAFLVLRIAIWLTGADFTGRLCAGSTDDQHLHLLMDDLKAADC